MSRYFIDTEFIEGFHKPLFGKKRHFIDLISIGIVAEDGREYYAISKDFDLKSSWNKYDIIPATPTEPKEKIYWLRENVLKPIFNDFRYKFNPAQHDISDINTNKLTYNNFKLLLAAYGKSNNQIAEEVFQFCTDDTLTIEKAKFYNVVKEGIEFYGHNCDYDWVLFCSLFGRMIDLPKGFPMYCRDLKQMLDEYVQCEIKKCDSVKSEYYLSHYDGYHLTSEGIKHAIKNKVSFPKQTNEHNALADAKWNIELCNFLKELGK